MFVGHYGVAFAVRSERNQIPLWVLFVAVQLLDLIVHRPDLAIYDDVLKIGFGLWNHRGLEFGFEIAILVGGILIYLKRNSSIARKAGIVAFGVVLILIQVWNTFAGRRPTSDRT